MSPAGTQRGCWWWASVFGCVLVTGERLWLIVVRGLYYIQKMAHGCAESQCHDAVCVYVEDLRCITGSTVHAQVCERSCLLVLLLTNNELWRKENRAEKRRSRGCIVRESKGGVIRPNGSQMAGCQWREKRDELLIGTRRTQMPLNRRWERKRVRENQMQHGPCSLAK